MRFATLLLSFATLFVCCLLVPTPSVAQLMRVQEVPRFGQVGIAKLTRNRQGAKVIYYNPNTCRRLGRDACAFFRAHEYGHVALRHLERGTPPRIAEREADLWAARNSSPQVVQGALRYFRRGGGGSLRHGTSQTRAQRVLFGAGLRSR